jgi:hypothetical protein
MKISVQLGLNVFWLSTLLKLDYDWLQNQIETFLPRTHTDECRVKDKLTHPTCSFPRLLRYVLSQVVTTMGLKTCLAGTKNYGVVFTSFHH